MNKIKIKYKTFSRKTIRLFGNIFVKNNKYTCKIEINGIERELEEYYIGNNNIFELEIYLIGIENIKNMSCMFKGCESLSVLLDISKWNTSKVIDMSSMFEGCKSLSSLSNISKWNTSRVYRKNNMFNGCLSLSLLPGFYKWNNDVFKEFISLISLPNI